jgi:thiol-disulfide isomerase/thioredoxin
MKLLLAITCAFLGFVGSRISAANVDPFKESASAKALVLVFVSNECPIANRYAPEIQRLQKQFSANQIVFYVVHADPSETQDSIERHSRAFGYMRGVLRDADQQLARRAGVHVTPAAAVFLPNGQRVYRGRIDNRYEDFGLSRHEATERDLQNALEAVVQGKPVPVAETRAIGCYIPFGR